MEDVKTIRLNSLNDAYKVAHCGTLYVYVATSLDEGWLAKCILPDLRWYERLVLVNREVSRGFLKEAGAESDFAFIGVAHGFLLFDAYNEKELYEGINLTRPWALSCVSSYVKDGSIDPKTYTFPTELD